MSHKKEIFELINSLTPNEKAYISKYLLKGNNKDSGYLKLFYFICKTKTNTVEKIKNEFKTSNISKNLAASFHYLYEQILDTIAPLGDKNSKEIFAWQQINHIHFLNQKALYTQSTKKITTLKRHLVKYEMYEILLILIQIEIELNPYLKKSLEEKQLLIQRKTEINQQIQDENIAQLQVNITEQLVFNYGVSTRNVANEMVDKTIHTLNRLLNQNHITLKSKHYIQHAFSNLAIVENKYTEAFNSLQVLIQEYEKQAHFKSHYISIYAKLLCNYINRLVSAGAFDKINDLDNIVKEINEIASNTKIEKAQLEAIYITYYHAKYAYQLSLQNFEEAYTMTQCMKEYKLPIEKNKALYIIYHYDFACAAFYVQKYDLTLHYTNCLLNHENRNAFPDVLIFTKIIQMFVWYEIEEYTMMQTQYEAIRKYLQTVNYDAIVEKTYLKMLLKLSTANNKNIKNQILIESDKNIKTLIKKYPSVFMFFKIFWWIDKEINRLK